MAKGERQIVQEQLDKLQLWWHQHGKTLLLGGGLVAVAAVGWFQFEQYQEDQVLTASALYQSMLEKLPTDGKIDATAIPKIEEASRSIQDEYPDSVYALLAGLVDVRIAVQHNQLVKAEQQLHDILQAEHLPEVLQPAVHLRLAKVLNAQGRQQEALDVLDRQAATYLIPYWHELRADIYLARGDLDGAQEYYQRAYELLGEQVPRLLALKVDELRSLLAAREQLSAQQRALQQRAAAAAPAEQSPGPASVSIGVKKPDSSAAEPAAAPEGQAAEAAKPTPQP